MGCLKVTFKPTFYQYGDSRVIYLPRGDSVQILVVKSKCDRFTHNTIRERDSTLNTRFLKERRDAKKDQQKNSLTNMKT